MKEERDDSLAFEGVLQNVTPDKRGLGGGGVKRREEGRGRGGGERGEEGKGTISALHDVAGTETSLRTS